MTVIDEYGFHQISGNHVKKFRPLNRLKEKYT
jgi:hypothetical protein